MKHNDQKTTIETARPVTLCDVRNLIIENNSLSPIQRRDYLSALNCISKWCGLSLADIPATRRSVRTLFDTLSPGGIGISKRRYENVRSAVNRTLQLVCAPQVRRVDPISSEWSKFVSQAKSDGDRNSLSKFARFCTAISVTADQVDDEVSCHYLDSLHNHSFVAKPREKHQAFCRAWNRLILQTGSNITRRLKVPKYANQYGIPRGSFPLSLQKEIEDYEAYLSCTDPLAGKAPQKPLRKISADARGKQLYAAASALVRSGVSTNDIDGLSVLVEVKNVKKILRFFIDRNDGQKSKMLSDIAQGLTKVALRYLDVPEEQLDQLRELKKRVKMEMNSMTTKNRKVLQSFNNAEMVSRFKTLPSKLFGAAEQGQPTKKKAILAQKAVAIAILMYAPMRLKNLSNLNLKTHLNWKINPGQIVIEIPGCEVKNEEDLVFELPKKVAEFVNIYLSKFRPLLISEPNDFLFPGQNGASKSSNNLSQQIAKRVFLELGVRLTVHQFRHLMGKIFLDNNPGQYEVLRRVLAHRSIETTIAYYAGEETQSAVRHYQDQIFGDMDELSIQNKKWSS